MGERVGLCHLSGIQLIRNVFTAALLHSILTFIEENDHIGAWSCELANNSVYWSPQLYTLLGVEPSRIKLSFDVYEQIVHPDDRSNLGEKHAVELGGPVGDREFRVFDRTAQFAGSAAWDRCCTGPMGRHGAPLDLLGMSRRYEKPGPVRPALEGTRQALRKLAGGDVWISSPWDSVGGTPAVWPGWD